MQGLHKSGLVLLALAALLTVAGCGKKRERIGSKDLNCMTRVMFFESIQSSRDGLVAVGTVVMNRVESPDFPDTVCDVVSQRGQFAPGVMTRRMEGRWAGYASEAARDVLAGERHPRVKRARFFHAASYRAGYNNMHYVVTTGGNAFYEKRPPSEVTQPRPVAATEGLTGG